MCSFAAKRSANDKSIPSLDYARGVVADGKVNQAEAEFLYRWLIGNQGAINDKPHDHGPYGKGWRYARRRRA